MVDFNQLFEDYLLEHVQVSEDTDPDAVEEMVEDAYLEFLHTPHGELQGKTPEEYLKPLPTEALVDMALFAAEGEKAPSPILLALLDEREDTGELLRETVEDARHYTVKQREWALSYLLETENRQALLPSVELVLHEAENASLADLAAEVVIAQGGHEEFHLVLQAMTQAKEMDQLMRYCDIISSFGGEEAYRVISALFEAQPTAFLAQCLERIGDDRAIEVLSRHLRDENLGYLEYLALRDAIEALGGLVEIDREYSGERDYEALRQLNDEEV